MTTAEFPRYFGDAELRVVDGPAGRPRIVGYAAIYNSLSHDLGGFREKIAPGAFSEAMNPNNEVLALMFHDPSRILGRRSAGTLNLREDPKGLYVEIDPPNTAIGNDAIENVRRKDINGMSFRFPRGAKDSWGREGSENVRTLHKCGLMEVTLTPIPAYPGTSASLRALWGDDEETRAYYAQKIKELTGPAPTPRLDMAERRFRLINRAE
jgi:HK97 family phage prohead protease